MVGGVSMGMRRPLDLRSVNKKTVRPSYLWMKRITQLQIYFCLVLNEEIKII